MNIVKNMESNKELKEIRKRLTKNALIKPLYADNAAYSRIYKKAVSNIPPKTFTRMSNEAANAISEYGSKILTAVKRVIEGRTEINTVFDIIYDAIGNGVDILYHRLSSLTDKKSKHLYDIKDDSSLNYAAFYSTIAIVPQLLCTELCNLAMANAGDPLKVITYLALILMRSLISPIVEEWARTFLISIDGKYGELSAVFATTNTLSFFITHKKFFNDSFGIDISSTDSSKYFIYALYFLSQVITTSLELLVTNSSKKMRNWCFFLGTIMNISFKTFLEKSTRKRPRR